MRLLSIVVLSGVLGIFASNLVAADDEKGDQQHVDVGADRATHEEVEPLDIEFEKLSALRLLPDGRLLAGDETARLIKVIDADGKLVDTIRLEFNPESIGVADDGTIYCGGEDHVAMLDKSGKVLKTITMPGVVETSEATEESTSDSETSDSDEPPRRRRSSRKRRLSGLAISDKDVFAAYGSSWSLRSLSDLYRFNRDLEKPELIAEGLRGCCQRCDLVTRDGVVYIAENARYRVKCLDRDGNEKNTWGSKTRTDLEGFGACCNPMNLCFDAAGNLYTSESGLARVKCYSTDGDFHDLVGYIGTQRFVRAGHLAASCSNIAIAVTPDGDRVYVMDYTDNVIRVLKKK